jgi:hypothetical protein
VRLVPLGLLLSACGVVACGAAHSEQEIVADLPTAERVSASSTAWRDRFRRTTPRPFSSGPVDVDTLSTAPRTGTKKEKDAARKAFAEGTTLFDAKSYEEAALKFAEAHRLVPGAIPLWKLSRCLKELGDVHGACRATSLSIEMFEQNRDPSVNAKRIEEAKHQLVDLRCAAP